MTLEQLAQKLWQAEKEAVGMEPLTQLQQGLQVEDAYKIQMINIGKKLAGGAKVIGRKIGLTSKGMQNLLNVGEPDYGCLLDDMLLYSGALLQRGRFVAPKVEGEIAFVLKEDLEGPGISLSDVHCATAYIVPAIEIVDSRVRNWEIKLEDTIADNASSAMLVLGEGRQDPNDFDLKNIGMYILKNGVLANSGAGIEVMGHPGIAVQWLANKLAEFGMMLKKGDVIISGAFTAALPAERGDVFEVSFDRMGSVRVAFE